MKKLLALIPAFLLFVACEQLGKYVCRVFELKVSIRHNSKSVFYKMSQCFKEAKWVVHNAICCIR